MRKVTEDYIGTCQACFGEFKVGADKRMVLHGYRRPGNGYTIGNCPGTDHAPFEYETELTVRIIKQHRDHVATQQDYLAKLNNGAIVELVRTFDVYDETKRRTVTKQERVTPDSKHWDRTLLITVTNTQNEIVFVTRLGDYLQGRVDAWTLLPIIGFELPLTGKERGLRKAYDPDEVAAEEVRAAEKAARDAKPGKLKVLFYRPQVRDEVKCTSDDEWRARYDRITAEKKAWLDQRKAWVKSTFTGKVIVRESYDHDLPRAISRTGAFDVISVNLPWEYRDQIVAMIPDAMIAVNEKKNIQYTVEVK